jgi:hypothetical protein
MLRTLTNVSDLLARVQGRRKALVLISEGVDYPLQEGITQTSSGVSTFTSPYASSVLRDFQQAIRAAALANASIYSIDPRGLAGTGDELIEVGNFPENPHLGLGPATFQDEIRQAQDTLRVLSDETGGAAFVTSNDFTGAFDRIVRDNSTYYVLGYRSTDTRKDNRFRKIEVRVRRPGVRVRARSGYSAAPREAPDSGFLSVDAEGSPVLRNTLNAPLPMSALPMRVFAAPFKGDTEASVSVGVEIDARNFRFVEKDGVYTNTLEVALVALDAQAKFRGGDRHVMNFKLKPDTYKSVSQNGLRVLFRLKLPPGRYQLRAAAHEHGTNVTGSVFYDLDVPDFQSSPLTLSGLVVTSGSAARIPTARPDPNFAGLLPSPPTGLRRFSRSETLTALFQVYRRPQTGGGAVDLVTTVRDGGGQIRFRVEEQVDEATLRQAEGGFGYALKIPLADLDPGAYALRVEARPRASGGAAEARELPFEVL